MPRAMFIALIGFLVGSGQLLAEPSGTTWFCSALLNKSDKKPSAFKFIVQGAELIDFNVWQNAAWKKWELKDPKELTRYKIVENTTNSLVAVHSYGVDNNSGTSAIVVLIDKVSNEFRQTMIETKNTEPAVNYEGTCLPEK